MEKIKEIQKFMKSLGFSSIESKIYLSLLNLGPSTITKLSRRTQIPRTSVHRYIERLIEKGFVSQTYKANTRTVIAEDPKKLELIIREKEIELENKSENIDDLRKSLPKIINSIRNNIPNVDLKTKIAVKYYEDKNGIKSIYQEAFAAKELRSYVNLSAVHEVFKENASLYDQYQKQNKSLFVKEIIDNSPASIKIASQFSERKNFEYKISAIPINLSSIDILIYDGKVAMVNYKELLGSVLMNWDYYENSKTIFDYIWHTLSS